MTDKAMHDRANNAAGAALSALGETSGLRADEETRQKIFDIMFDGVIKEEPQTDEEAVHVALQAMLTWEMSNC